MASIIKVDNIQDQAGNNIINESGGTITIGTAGNTVSFASNLSFSSLTIAGNLSVDSGTGPAQPPAYRSPGLHYLAFIGHRYRA